MNPNEFDWRAHRPVGELRRFSRYMQLAKFEPALVPLLIKVMAEQPTTDKFYLEIKPRFCELVGGDATSPLMQRSSDYDVVYELLYSFVDDRGAA